MHSNYRQGFTVEGVRALNLRQRTGFDTDGFGGWGLASPQRSALGSESEGIWQRKCSFERWTVQLDCTDDRSPRREVNEDPVPSFVARRGRPGSGRIRSARCAHRVGCYRRDEEPGECDQRRVLERGRQPHFRRHYLVFSNTTVLGPLEGASPLQCPSSSQGARWWSGKSRDREMREGRSRSMPLADHCGTRLRVVPATTVSDSPLAVHRLRSCQWASDHGARPGVLRRKRQCEFPLNSSPRDRRNPLQWSECKPDPRERALPGRAPVNMAPVLRDTV